MTKKRNGMNDFDNIFVTVALWVSMAALFAVSLTLPMLPDQVTIFYKPNDYDINYYSKYNNLLSVIFSVIPAGIIILAAALRKHNRMQRNFSSILLFCIMISLCCGGVVMFGISKQFNADYELNSVDVHTLIVLVVSLLLSLTFASTPMIVHAPTSMAKVNKRTERQTVRLEVLEEYWGIGAFGYIAVGIIGSFIPGVFAYIPLATYIMAHLIFTVGVVQRRLKHRAQAETVENNNDNNDNGK